MGLEQVKSEILEDAEEKADRIVEEADEEREQIIDEAEQEAEKILEEAREEVEQRKEAIERKELSNARMEAREEKLEARQEWIDRVFQEFRDRLGELDAGERDSYVENCVSRVGFDIGRIIGSEEFREAVEDAGHDFEAGEKEGITIVSENGERRQDFSFDRIVERFRDEYSREVAQRLFQ